MSLVKSGSRLRWTRRCAGLLIVACLAVSDCAWTPPTEPGISITDGILITIGTDPSWSPDGRFIAYTHVASTIDEGALGFDQVWLYDLAADTARYVGPGRLPAWTTPRGDSLLFLEGGRVFAYGLVSGALSPVTGMDGVSGFAWSPTAPQLVVSADLPGPVGPARLWLVPLDESPARNISTVDYQGAWLEPQFSPDGSRVVHERAIRGTFGTELFTMDTSGTAAARLTSDQVDDRTPSWSPDGTHIAWTHGTDVWVMNRDGSGQRLLLASSQRPTWSPDGSQLVVTRFTGAVRKDGFFLDTLSLWRVHSDGTGAQRLPGLPRQIMPVP